MVEQTRPVIQHEAGAIACGSIRIGDIWKMAAAGTPTDGTSGDGAGFAGPGSEYTDTTGAKLYINTNTKASPTWTVVGTQSA